MKITAGEAIHLSYPFRHGGPPSGWGGKAWTELQTLLVKVDTDAGITGWGESFGYNAIPATKATTIRRVRFFVRFRLLPGCAGKPDCGSVQCSG